MWPWADVKTFPQVNEDLLFADIQERVRQYDARASVADFETTIAEYTELSRQADARCPSVRDLRYGQASSERLDIFPLCADQQPAPVFIFIHGGYWRGQTKENAAMLALHLTQAGIAVVTLEYALLPRSTLFEAVRQVRAAVAWLHANAHVYGLDNTRFVVGGSSAGAHLSAMVAAQGWTEEYHLPFDCIKGLVGLSGLYDLRPLCDIDINAWLQMHADQAWRVSPVCHLPRPGLPVLLSVGGLETDGFKAQTDAYQRLGQAHGLNITRYDVAACNHFNLLVELTRGDSPLTARLCEMMTKL